MDLKTAMGKMQAQFKDAQKHNAFHRDYVAALVQLQRQGVWAVNGVSIEKQLAQFRKENANA